LTNPEGLKGRPWFIHEIYAPGFYTGYSVKTLPGAREAIEQRQWEEADRQMVVIAGTLEAYAREIRRAAAILAATSK
jgi:N-acetylated-alpha-linked acidic dipeptidase